MFKKTHILLLLSIFAASLQANLQTNELLAVQNDVICHHVCSMRDAIYRHNDQLCRKLLREHHFNSQELTALSEAQQEAGRLYCAAYESGAGADLAKGIAVGTATAAATAASVPAVYHLGAGCVAATTTCAAISPLFPVVAVPTLALIGTGIGAGIYSSVSYIRSSYHKSKLKREYVKADRICQAFERFVA